MAAQALNYEVMAAEEIEVTPEMIRAVLSHLGRRNGKTSGHLGGLKAAANMTAEQRSERARKASLARYAKARETQTEK
jgi:hypothetical protein